MSAHEQLQTNVNTFWGPEQAPFRYTMSKWGRESSVEMLSDSDDSYQTPPIMGSSQWDQLRGEPNSEEAGEICRSPKSWKSLSSIWSQPHVLPSSGLMRIHRRRGRQAKGKLMKASWTVRAQFFTFQISTFDKSGFPRALIITWKSHHSPYPLVFLPPLRLTHQDEHGQE